MTVPSSTPDPAEKPGLNDPTLAENGSSPRNDKEPPTILYRDAGRQSQQPQELTERLFGKYELLAEIGRGGMGVVFKARQTEPDRTVAVKMIISGTVSSPEEVQRFRTEAEAAGRLQHANIVKVYEVGEVGGRYFYSMEYIEGPNLSQRVEKGPLPSKVAARYLAAIARAVHHAHRQGILHRDLKPSNILMDAEDQPHITDFGLAKRLGDSGQTHTGTVIGTPSYMPPEQAAGRIRDLDARSDVYSLGAVLYELLTGRPPFQSETALDTLLHVMERQAAPPRLLNPKVDRDLELICLKCLEKDPQQRYPTAEALAEDIERYIKGDPISARSFNMLERISRTLESDQYLAEFQTWGLMVLIFAAVILVEHLIVFFLTLGGPPYPRGWIMLARFSQFTVMGLVFWRHRAYTLLPTSAAERQLWTIWIGYLIGCMAVGVVNSQLRAADVLHHGLAMYPYWSILTGLAFFMMGNSFWGRCYLLGLGFLVLAGLMPFDLRWSPLIFGLAWSAALTAIGLHLRSMGKTLEPEVNSFGSKNTVVELPQSKDAAQSK